MIWKYGYMTQTAVTVHPLQGPTAQGKMMYV